MRTIRNCNVAVIGGSGFLGSHLVDHLIEDRGCMVVVIDNLEAGRREFVNPKASFYHHDITGSEEFIRQVLQSRYIHFVFNYAARPYVPDSYKRPLRTWDVNAMGALKVINAAQEAGVEAILQVSSAEVYGEFWGDETASKEQGVKLREDAPVKPHSSYGASKAVIDSACQIRWREAMTPVIALRQFNCLGERETHPYIVPEIIGQLSKQGGVFECSRCGGTGEGWRNQGTGDGEGFRPGTCNFCDGVGEKWQPEKQGIVKLGNNSFRDFLYAGDAVRIAVELLERGQFGEVFNSGSETGTKIYDLAQTIGRLMGFASVKVERDESRVRPWDIWHLQSSNDKLYSVIDYRPKTGLEDALKKTIVWFEQNGRRWPWE